MSDEVISIEEVIAYSLDNFPGVIEAWNWGERSLFYNPHHQLPKGTYFLTFKEKDGANDSASRIRHGDYRLNVGISKVAFTDRFGAVPARPAAGGVVMKQQTAEQMDAMQGCERCWPTPSTPRKVASRCHPRSRIFMRHHKM